MVNPMKARAASCCRGTSFCLNVACFASGAAIVALMFVLRPLPTYFGWWIVATGVATLLSGALGMAFTDRFGCCGIHLICFVLSLAGCAATAVLILVKPSLVSSVVQPTLWRSTADILLLAEGVVAAAGSTLQLLIILLRAHMQCHRLVGYDIESQAAAVEKQRQQARQEYEAQWQANIAKAKAREEARAQGNLPKPQAKEEAAVGGNAAKAGAGAHASMEGNVGGSRYEAARAESEKRGLEGKKLVAASNDETTPGRHAGGGERIKEARVTSVAAAAEKRPEG